MPIQRRRASTGLLLLLTVPLGITTCLAPTELPPDRPPSAGVRASYAGFEEPFGIFGPTRRSFFHDEIAELGERWFRVHFTTAWGIVEAAPGRWDFSGLDPIVASLRAHGFKLLMTTHARNQWATGAKGRGNEGQRQEVSVAAPPKDMEQYRAYIRKLVTRYADDVDAWQVENEVYGNRNNFAGSAQQYAELVKETSRIVRELDPTAKVVLSGIALGALDLRPGKADGDAKLHDLLSDLRYVLREHKDDYDIVDIHLYYRWDHIPVRVKWLQSLLAEAGASDKEIWTTECGGPDPRARVPLTDEIQAQEVVKRHAAAFGSGLKKFFYVNAVDQPAGVNNPWAKMGLMRSDRETVTGKKPAYFVLQRLIETLEPFASVDWMDAPDGIWWFRFHRAGAGTVSILWAEGSHRFEVPAVATAKLIGLDGKPIDLDVAEGKARLSLSESPVYLVD